MGIVKLLSGLLGVIVLLAAAAPAAAGAYEPCPNDGKSYSWSGESVAEPVSIPSLTQPDGITAYDGAMWRPADSVAYPGKRPVVLLQHGLGGNKCRLAWVARYVAGHGYVAVTWTAPTGAGNGQSFVHAFDAMNSALAWMRTPANPQLAISDTDRITVGGGSLGSIVTSYVQGLGDPGIKAALAFDNLRRWISGDPGAAAGECEGAPTVEVTPTVPALGFAKDEPCNALPDVTDPDIKIKGGFDWWRANGVPSMVLSMAGYSHGDLTAGNGGEQKNLQVIHYVDAWLRLWIEGDQSAVADLLSPTVAGRPTTDFLSTNYLSGALPGTVDATDFATWLRRDVTRPARAPRRPVEADRARPGPAQGDQVPVRLRRSRGEVRVPLRQAGLALVQVAEDRQAREGRQAHLPDEGDRPFGQQQPDQEVEVQGRALRVRLSRALRLIRPAGSPV